ncbi:hypothetical protein EV198_2976 [Roseivirga ehrenbergii]|nr:hypothetical protein EV198_2976 [Roseivirga ehrenbergii]
MLKMGRLFFCVWLCLFYTIPVLSQNTNRPELSKREIRKLNKNLDKLSKSLDKHTSKLKVLLKLKQENLTFQVDVLQDADKDVVLEIDSIKRGVDKKLEGFQSEIFDVDSITIPQGLRDEIARLKKELKVGMQLSKSDPKLTNQLQDSFIKLSGAEYDLKEAEDLFPDLNKLKINQETINEYIEPISSDFALLRDQIQSFQSSIDRYKAELTDWDKTLESQIMKLEDVNGLSQFRNNSLDPSSETSRMQNELEGYQSKSFVQKQMEERFSKMLEEDGQDALVKRLTEGREKIAEAKEKYTKVQDLNNPDQKRNNPLKGKSFIERLSFGGNLQVNRVEPISLDVGGELAYQISPKSELGAGSAYRLRLQKKILAGVSSDNFNVRGFYNHVIWRNIRLQGNYELDYLVLNNPQADSEIKDWVQSGLIGFKQEQPFFKKIKGYMTVQYDFLHSAESANSRWVVRFGFRFK